MIRTIVWSPDAACPTIRILDQTRLPREEVYLDLDTIPDLCEAILALRIRGAPAIGIAGAYGVALAARLAAREVPERDAPGAGGGGAPDLLARIETDASRLRAVRPTAVNLAWAIDRVLARLRASRAPGGSAARPAPAGDLASLALAEARAIHDEDLAMSRAMGAHGAALLPHGAGILTHCNTGGLATGGLGTALAVVFTAHDQGKAPRVFADETRPLLQGARLTMWELARAGIPATLIVDGAAAWAMKRQRIDAVLVGADRIAANGDAANKIGTYGLAIAAARHGVPFYVVAPSSTFDPALPSGDAIPIEERPATEVLAGWSAGASDADAAPSSAGAWNPAFDVTPAELITGWVSEQGVRRRGDFA
jgi:methylthioribose-1-phosphate isomerase